MAAAHEDNLPGATAPLGHSKNSHGEDEPLHLHLLRTAEYARRFGSRLGCGEEAEYAALLHDLGKLGPEFARRLRGEIRGVDHWSCGAWHISNWLRANSAAGALAILGHHAGLPACNKDLFRGLEPQTLRENLKKAGKTLSYSDEARARAWLAESGINLPPLTASFCPFGDIHQAGDPQKGRGYCAVQLDLRMIFSVLADADFLATEGHFNAPRRGEVYVRPQMPGLESGRALACLRGYIKRRRQELSARAPAAGVSSGMMSLRNDLLAAALTAADSPAGLFTLTAPTGAGKTLAILAFALRHAERNNLPGRIIVVLPYLSIIEQTAQEYRRIFGAEFPADYVLEHHSLSGGGDAADRADTSSEAVLRQRMLTENWDAPIVITTSVQFFESLFSNRPGACRKLHNLAGSIIVFDEAQTLPGTLAIETLATLAHLSGRYNTSVVFSTATQPAFGSLHAEVRKLAAEGWKPREIVPPELRLFDRAKRTRVVWPQRDERTQWPELAARLASYPQVLCILNLKRHATRLIEELRGADCPGLLHLSTNMCAAHRLVVLAEVRRRLEAGEACRLVATQCVEAGVDLDFPTVYRAFAPLEAVAQAAGRCNRNGRAALAEVVVFNPAPEEGKPERFMYPTGDYQQAANTLQNLLAAGDVDINDPAVYERYYLSLYNISGLAQKSGGNKLRNAVTSHDFPEIADSYRLIDNRAVNVLVPYDLEVYAELARQARERGISAGWVKRARNHAVSVFNPQTLQGMLEPVPLFPAGRGGEMGERAVAEDWFILLDEAAYDRELAGLVCNPSNYIA